ncbi:MAG: DMT family transporter [Bryobacteraceae bacterium]|jgi:drug/metabolite transporter (DMT)-like permease
MTASPIRSRLLLVAAAILFSTGGAAIKSATLTGWQVACFRSGVAALVLLAALPQARRGWSWRIAPVAAAYAATLIAFVMANRLTTSADAIFLQSTAPLYLLLLGPLLLKEPIHRAGLFYMLAVAAGMALFFVGGQPVLATAPDPPRGNLVALFSGLAYALTLAGLRWLGRRPECDAGLAAVAMGNALACVATLPMAFPLRSLSFADGAVILYLGVFQIGLAYVCVTRAMRQVTAFEANTVLLLEPALNPVWAWMVHGERPPAMALTGGAIILSATLVHTWRQRRA